jgi:hypothetical protein
MSHFHFQNPNTALTQRRLHELSQQLDDVNVGIDLKRNNLREIYRSLVATGTDAIRIQLTIWYRLPDLTSVDITGFLERHLIPTPTKCSDLAKKRRQTPRRRYTVKRKSTDPSK